MADHNKDSGWGIAAVIVAILVLIAMNSNDSGGSSTYGSNCYDADPTYYEDIVCD